MSNCNTPTCAIDGKITPENPDGTPVQMDAAMNAEPCGERGRRGERARRGATDEQPAPPRRDVQLGQPPTQTGTVITVENPYGGGERVTTGPTVASREVPFDGVVPRRAPSPPPSNGNTPSITLLRGSEGSDLTGRPPVTLARANPGEVHTFTRAAPPVPTASAPTPEQLAAMSPKEREVFTSRAAYAQSQGTTPAGAPQSTAEHCYAVFLTLPADVQARIMTTGQLGRYGIAQAVARDTMNGVASAPEFGARWVFKNFPLNSDVVAQFCAAVLHFAPAANPSGALVMLESGGDRWTRGYGVAQDGLRREFRPSGDLALIDYPTARQVFATLSPAQQADVLRGTAFLGDAYAPALANALALTGTIDGESVPNLLAAHMERFSGARRVLFQLAVQDAARTAATSVPAGLVHTINPAGTPPATTTTRPATTTTRPATPTTPAPAAPSLPAEFLQQSGLTGTQWAALLADHPDVATQLWHEYQSRPSTFATVASTSLQAIGVIITGVHQGRVDDLAASNAQYAHQQAMAQLAAARQQSADSAEIARLEAAARATQQTVMQYQTTPPPAATTPPAGLTTTQLAVGGVSLAVVITAAVYMFTRSRRKRSGGRRRRGARSAARAS